MVAWGKPLVFALVVGLCAGCSGSQAPGEGGGASPAAAASSVPSAAADGTLPGNEALTPPPADPAAPSQVATLAAVPDGPFSGHLRLTLSGLAAFDEPVAGSCSGMAVRPVVAVRLADGSQLDVTFDGERATSVLRAPGIEEHHVLDGVRTTVTGTSVAVEADLLTAGTSERAGDLALSGRCG
jgi:hypothetical protein